MTKKATHKKLQLAFVGPEPPGRRTVATHVFVDGPAGRVEVPVGAEFVVPADQVAGYRAARLPRGYHWVGHVRAARDLGDSADADTDADDTDETADTADSSDAAPATDDSLATAPAEAAEEDHANG